MTNDGINIQNNLFDCLQRCVVYQCKSLYIHHVMSRALIISNSFKFHTVYNSIDSICLRSAVTRIPITDFTAISWESREIWATPWSNEQTCDMLNTDPIYVRECVCVFHCTHNGQSVEWQSCGMSHMRSQLLLFFFNKPIYNVQFDIRERIHGSVDYSCTHAHTHVTREFSALNIRVI
jgi:hypothetical protein